MPLQRCPIIDSNDMMLPRRLWRRGQSRRLGSHRAGGRYCRAAAPSLAVPSSRLSETQPPTSKSELQDADRGADLWPARGGHAGSRSESRSAYTDSGQAEGHRPLETGTSTRTEPLPRQGRKQMHRQVPKRVHRQVQNRLLRQVPAPTVVAISKFCSRHCPL